VTEIQVLLMEQSTLNQYI